MTEESERGSTPFERFVQYVFQVGVVGAVVWALSLLWSMNTQLAKQGEVIIQMRSQIVELKDETADRYRGEDARRDFAHVHRLIEDHEKRIRELEKRD